MKKVSTSPRAATDQSENPAKADEAHGSPTLILASIASKTDAQGKTALNIESDSSPFGSAEGLSSQRFGDDDVGKVVACMPMLGTCLLYTSPSPRDA